MVDYKNIEKQVYNYYKKYIDSRYIFSIVININNIDISIKHNSKLIDSSNFQYKDYNNNIIEAIGNLHAYWDLNEKTSILVCLVSGFWNIIEDIKDPLKGLGIGKFLMTIYIDIIQRLGMHTSELDDNCDILYDNNNNPKKSFYTKFNYIKIQEYGPEMILENVQNNSMNLQQIIYNIMVDNNNNQFWKWKNY